MLFPLALFLFSSTIFPFPFLFRKLRCTVNHEPREGAPHRRGKASLHHHRIRRSAFRFPSLVLIVRPPPPHRPPHWSSTSSQQETRHSTAGVGGGSAASSPGEGTLVTDSGTCSSLARAAAATRTPGHTSSEHCPFALPRIPSLQCSRGMGGGRVCVTRGEEREGGVTWYGILSAHS